MSIVWSSAPVIAPFIGGYLEKFFSWQANFYLLAIYAFVMLILEWIFSGETVQSWRQFKSKQVLKDYRSMLRDKGFAWGIIICGLAYGSTMIFSLAGAFIIEHQLGFSAVVAGYASLLMGLAWMAGGFIGKAMIGKPFLLKLRWSNALQLIFTIAMIGMAAFMYNIYTLLLFAFLIHICVGFMFNNYFAYCLGHFPAMAGLASGLTGGGVYIVTSFTSYSVVGLLQPQNQQQMGYGYIVMAVAIFVILHFLLKKVNSN
ncbi:MFS transporter [Niabella ginsengisoli]|uniref:MFS transporter n=1 Tax=Niabella ginsengisoli TaxID=522298 RepID=UPI0021D3FD13|nr:MFS transporter [Niabella ginsengisoli]